MSLLVSIKRSALGFVLLAAIAAPAAQAVQPPTAGKPIDPQRYLGRWYEVARVPNAFQKNCEAATSDWSRDKSGLFNVVQTCHEGAPSGPPKVWRGSGKVVDQATAKFRIGFFGGFVKQDYVVLDRSDDYSWCILSTANPKYFWIMSRRAVLSAAQKSTLAGRARQLGFDVSALVYDAQPPG